MFEFISFKQKTLQMVMLNDNFHVEINLVNTFYVLVRYIQKSNLVLFVLNI